MAKASWRTVVGAGFFLAFVVAAVWSIIDLDINLSTIAQSWDNAVRFFGLVFPLDFPSLGETLVMTGQTLAIVAVATLLSVVISTAAALFGAKPTSKSPAVRTVARGFIVVMRAIPELVFAIFFMRLFGFGALGGVLALAFHSVGMVGKMYADAIEDADDGPRAALEATGASRIQQIFGATLPGIVPAMIATGLHRFDINLRASVVLGWVGVSGIGMELSSALSIRDYDRGMAIAVIVLLLCIATEVLSGYLRGKVLGKKQEPARFGVLWAAKKMRERFRVAPAGQPLSASRVTLGTRTTPPWDATRVSNTIYAGLTVALIAVAFLAADANWLRLVTSFGELPHVVGQFWPPSDGGIAPRLWAELLVTLQIALAAALLGLILALPVGILAAQNVTGNPHVVRFFRTVVVVTRGIPELILAIIFVIISGLGALAGTLALAIGAVGLLSKLVADSLEDTDTRVQEALRASGANRTQVFFGATLRQAAPAIVAHVFYQLDVNFRSATLLGIVGAGGIGFYLLNARRVLDFDVVTYILLLIVFVVLLLEFLAQFMRRIVR
ncbi:phosphonate ABC transporter, permease protein PhnE [Gulosibacter chungangensis]|uniref:Phosphonate ABC transporter, permease protein PhnE n=1 Tax=Gulosibacter chungangensis TaxID=979746 RepID=A0A7J5B8S1_9MICO|nr:phosphonate ABC transporter, permease protein PhnE [Gulosibacter chungangensis]